MLALCASYKGPVWIRRRGWTWREEKKKTYLDLRMAVFESKVTCDQTNPNRSRIYWTAAPHESGNNKRMYRVVSLLYSSTQWSSCDKSWYVLGVLLNSYTKSNSLILTKYAGVSSSSNVHEDVGIERCVLWVCFYIPFHGYRNGLYYFYFRGAIKHSKHLTSSGDACRI